MGRLSVVALIAVSLPAAGWGNPPRNDPSELRTFHLPQLADQLGMDGQKRFGRKQIAPNAHFGFGLFGLKTERSPLRPATVREIDEPKQRRAAVGFSLEF